MKEEPSFARTFHVLGCAECGQTLNPQPSQERYLHSYGGQKCSQAGKAFKMYLYELEELEVPKHN